MQTQILKTFQLGKSTVVTLPKSLGITPGTRVKVKKLRKKIIMEPEEDDVAKKIALVEKLAKKAQVGFSEAYRKKVGRELTPEELNKIFEESYETVLPRRKRSSLF